MVYASLTSHKDICLQLQKDPIILKSDLQPAQFFVVRFNFVRGMQIKLMVNNNLND